jgi:hypothetical protein
MYLTKILYDNIKLVVFGDFNININNKSDSDSLLTFIENFGLVNSIGYDLSSTNYNTQIDICFTTKNLAKQLRSGYFESLYSYHKPIWMLYNTDATNETFYKENIKRSYPLILNEDRLAKKLKLTTVFKDNYFIKLSNVISNSCYANTIIFELWHPSIQASKILLHFFKHK